MALYVKSAGFVVYRQRGRGAPLFLLVRSKRYGEWGFPKGALERGETGSEAAVRELGEETGIRDFFAVRGFYAAYRYSFARGGKSVAERVVLYLACTDTRKVALSSEHTAYRWLPYQEAFQALTFPNARALLTRARAHLVRAAPLVRQQERVYRFVARIPKGKVAAYRDIARALRLPDRRVAAALSVNFNRRVPCHRVVHANGSVGGYNRGVERKIVLLKKEGVVVSGSRKSARIKDLKRFLAT